MREKYNIEDYSFFLQAKDKTNVVVKVFRKDQEVVSKEFNSLDESFWDLFRSDTIRREKLFIRAKQWGSDYIRQMFNNEKEYTRIDIIKESVTAEVVDEYINNLIEKTTPNDKASLITTIKTMCKRLNMIYDNSIEKAELEEIREKAKTLRFFYYIKPNCKKLNY